MCEEKITKKDLLKTLRKISNNKLPPNDENTRELYQNFWKVLKVALAAAIIKAFWLRLINSSETNDFQINWKKVKDKRFIKNWRFISLLYVDAKRVWNVSTESLTHVLNDLKFYDQTTYAFVNL